MNDHLSDYESMTAHHKFNGVTTPTPDDASLSNSLMPSASETSTYVYYPPLTAPRSERRSSTGLPHPEISIRVEDTRDAQPLTPELRSGGSSINSNSLPNTPDRGQVRHPRVVIDDAGFLSARPYWSPQEALSSAPSSPNDSPNCIDPDSYKIHVDSRPPTRRRSRSTSDVAQNDVHPRGVHPISGFQNTNVHTSNATATVTQPPLNYTGAQAQFRNWRGYVPPCSPLSEVTSPLSPSPFTPLETPSPLLYFGSGAFNNSYASTDNVPDSLDGFPHLFHSNASLSGMGPNPTIQYDGYSPFPAPAGLGVFEGLGPLGGAPALTEPINDQMARGSFMGHIVTDDGTGFSYPQPRSEVSTTAPQMFFPPVTADTPGNIPTTVDPSSFLAQPFPTSPFGGPFSAPSVTRTNGSTSKRQAEVKCKEAVYDILVQSQSIEDAHETVTTLTKNHNEPGYLEQFNQARSHHPKESPTGKEKAQERRKRPPTFQCIICRDRMTTNNNLQNHYRSHLALRKFQCHHCLTSFATDSIRARHLRNTVKCPGYNPDAEVKSKKQTSGSDHGRGSSGSKTR